MRALEAGPGGAAMLLIYPPPRLIRPLPGAEPLSIQPRPLQFSGAFLHGGHMYGGIRKVIETTGVIKIQMRQYAMPYIICLETQAFYLTPCGHLAAEIGTTSGRKNQP